MPTKSPPLFDITEPRKPRRVMMHVCDAGETGCERNPGAHSVRLECTRCGRRTEWIEVKNVTEGKRGKPCPICNGGHDADAQG